MLFYGAIFHSHSECYQYTYFNIFRTICYFHFNTVKSSICCGFINFFSMVFCFIVYYNLFLRAQVIGPIIFSWYPGICLTLPITNMNFSSDSSNQFCAMEKNGCIEYHMLKMAEDLLAGVSELPLRPASWICSPSHYCYMSKRQTSLVLSHYMSETLSPEARQLD